MTGGIGPGPEGEKVANARVLVVDDDPLIRDIMEGLLGDSYELALASGGAEALEMAEKLCPAVVLLDVMMPGMDGHEVCRRMRQVACLGATKIILVSGNIPDDDHLGGPPSGADDFVLKPFDFGELVRKIEGVLDPQ